jgi:imidazolonepropionase-like amidohydrolase/Tol biopolymer transport system component
MTNKIWTSVLFSLALATLTAQEKKENEKPKWDVNNAFDNYKEVSFTVEEGTWMNLDVSPDGKKIVFDLLGDIFIMPVEGGKATILRQGPAYEVQPRFSPDGKKISFTSDAGGGDNIWVMNTDGSEAKQITKEDFRLLNNAIWSPDGNYIIARKHFTSTRSAGAGEMWMYHISGGAGLQLTKRKNDQQDAGEPWISADGKYVYYSEDVYPGGYFQYNKDPNAQIYVIKRLDIESGENETVVKGPGGAFRPVLSKDGNKLAFVRRVREKSVLYLHDLLTGEEWPIYDKLSKDQQEAWALFGVYTNYNFLPDNKHIIIWAKGKIRKINIENLSETTIPFSADMNVKIKEALHFKQDPAPDKFNVNVIRHAVSSPDGKMLVFNAVGYLWKKELPNGKPERVTNKQHFEYEPAFSADGKTLVYTTWNDEELGAIYKINISSKSAKPTKISSEKGIYRTPSFSPDGNTIVYVKESGNDHQGFSYTKEPGIYTIAANGGKPKKIYKSGEYPTFNALGNRIFYQEGGYLFGSPEKFFKSCDLNGNNIRTHYTSKHTNRFVPSPDNKWIAFIELHQAYVAPLITTGQAVELSNGNKSYPVSKISRDAGLNLHWSGDSKKICWTLGDTYYSNEISKRFNFLLGSGDSLAPIDTVGMKVGLELASDKPKGRIALINARIITMKGDEVIEKGTIIINQNKIEQIGANITVPAEAKVIDCSGKTIMPGMVDVHAHLGTFRYGQSPNKMWSYYANLAYGVTTTHDPSSNSEMVFTQSEMVKAGNMVGPRIFSTGTILYGAEGDFKAVINSPEDALSALRRTKAFGAFSVKSYNQPRRDQRQQVIKGAEKLGMLVVPEGGSHFLHNMSMVLDGHTGIEHNIPVAPVYDDVVKVWSASNTGYTPTLVVNYGGMTGEYYWYQKTNVWEKERLLRFTPRAIVDARSRHRTAVPDEEYEIGHIETSRSCKKLSDAGVKVNLGAHGQLQGLGAHWELWMLAQGGMSPLEAIRCATVNGAYYIGMEDHIGSLEEGKLADLIVLDANPLDDIYNTEQVKYTMINGRIYDAETMDEIGNYDRRRPPFYWENSKYSNAFDWHEETQGFHQHHCGCRK